MESRLKERLTGAAILVALIVLIVPEIFHDRRSAPTPTGVTTGAAAAANVPTRSYTIELTRPPAAAAPSPTDGARLPAGAPQRTSEAQPVAAEPAPTQPAAGAAKIAVPAGPPAQAPAKARVASAPAGHARSGGWTVQLGLFAKAANAEHLARMAQSHGFAVQISRFGSRELYRVGVTGIADRAAAEQLSHRLKGAGLPAAILGPR